MVAPVRCRHARRPRAARAGLVHGWPDDGTGTGSLTAPAPAPTSIVQLGDSVAAGEGTLYGYTYDRSSRRWTGGDLDATWPEPYPKCHHSPDAYGNRVAAAFGARFTQFACTGAQFDNGIATEEVYGGTTYRPPQFGDWAQQTGLNAEYDAAQPDLVLVTLGADDVHFVKIVTACVENTLEHRFLRFVGLECTRANHGAEVRDDFYANLAPLKEHYGTLVQWIAEPRRGSRCRRAEGRVHDVSRSAARRRRAVSRFELAAPVAAPLPGDAGGEAQPRDPHHGRGTRRPERHGGRHRPRVHARRRAPRLVQQRTRGPTD